MWLQRQSVACTVSYSIRLAVLLARGGAERNQGMVASTSDTGIPVDRRRIRVYENRPPDYPKPGAALTQAGKR